MIVWDSVFNCVALFASLVATITNINSFSIKEGMWWIMKVVSQKQQKHPIVQKVVSISEEQLRFPILDLMNSSNLMNL